MQQTAAADSTYTSGTTTRVLWRRDLLLTVTATALVALYAWMAGGGFPLDDSWIHQVYGRNLAQYGEWAFIPGQPSAASTAPLYTVLLAAGYALNLPYALWTHAIGVIALASAGMIAARMADRLIPRRGLAGLLVGLAVIFTWQLIWAAASGMETMLFAALTLLLMWLSWRELDTHNFVLPATASRQAVLRGAVFGAVAALLTLTRPEGILLAGLCGLALLVYRPAKLPLWIIGAAFGFGLLIAPYLLLNYSLTGGPLPNTAAAKQVQHEPLLVVSYPQRLLSMAAPLLIGAQVLLIPGMVLYAVRVLRRQERRTWLLYLLPLLWIIALVALYAARLPASYQHGRYVMPALPALIIAGTVGTLMLIQGRRPSLLIRAVSTALPIAAAMLFLTFALGLGARTYARDVAIINEEMVAAAHWIRDNLPDDALLAIHDIGAVGYFTPRPMIDVAGLLTPELIPLINDPEGMWQFIEASGATHLMAFPDQIPGDNPDDPRLCEVYISRGGTSPSIDGPSMAVYRLNAASACP